MPKRITWALNLWATFRRSLCLSLHQMHSARADMRKTRSGHERGRSAHGPQTQPGGRHQPRLSCRVTRPLRTAAGCPLSLTPTRLLCC